jgi:small subunit ribosomal protein S21
MTPAIAFGESGYYAIAAKSLRTATLADCAVLSLTGHPGVVCQVQVLVRDNNVDQALKALKKKLQREGVFREMKLRRHYEKPSERRAREAAEAVRRARKMERKRIEREGF